MVGLMKRALFVLRDVPRPSISIAGLFSGQEALSGTHSSTLLVAEGLARRGWEVAVLIMRGGKLVDTAVQTFEQIEPAASWAANARVVWSYYGDDGIVDQLNAARMAPIVWSHIHVPRIAREWLRAGKSSGLLTVSDTARLPLLRSTAHNRIGRVYNPLSPVFESQAAVHADRYSVGTVAFTGYLNVSKGAHRLLQLWPHARRLHPTATLLLVGSERLYGSGRPVGPNGLSTPAFEEQYLNPIVAEFGSLENAGIHPAGLLSPQDLRDLYAKCSLGIVNPNWHEYTETFCCSAVEMLATGLPVFGVARGALPETVGLTGGARLSEHEDTKQEANELVAMLRDQENLRRLGATGSQFVRQHYTLDRILDCWEEILSRPDRLESQAGPWRGPITRRYKIEKLAGRLGLESMLDLAAHTARALKLAG